MRIAILALVLCFFSGSYASQEKPVFVFPTTGGLPTCFGDVFAVLLANSRLSVGISWKYFIRPSGNPEYVLQGIVPDIEVPTTGRDLLLGLNPALEKAKDLIRAELMNRGSAQNNEIDERAAMKKLDFVIGKWEGEGWLAIGPDQRHPFSVTESYSYRCNGLVVDGEGRFRPQGVPEDAKTNTMYGLGMIYFDRPSSEYRMWHYGGTGSGFVFSQKIEIDVEQRALRYVNKDARGETYKFGFTIDDEGILRARSERQKPDGTWYVSMEFRMQRVK